MSKTGYIYKLCCKDVNVTDFYIGSTKNIKERKRAHKTSCYNPHDKKYNCKVYQYIRNNGVWENWDMIVLQTVKYNEKYELRKNEREEIEKLKPTLNTIMPDVLTSDVKGDLNSYHQKYRD